MDVPDTSQRKATRNPQQANRPTTLPKRRRFEENDSNNVEQLVQRVTKIGLKLGCTYIYLLEEKIGFDLDGVNETTDATDQFLLLSPQYDPPCQSIQVFRYRTTKSHTIDYSELGFIESETESTTTKEYESYLVAFEAYNKAYAITSAAIRTFATQLDLKVVTSPSTLEAIHEQLITIYTNLKRLKLNHGSASVTQSTDKQYQGEKEAHAAISKAKSQQSTVANVKVGRDRGEWVEYHPTTGAFRNTTQKHFSTLLTEIIKFHKRYSAPAEDLLLSDYEHLFCVAIQTGAYNLLNYPMDEVMFLFDDEKLSYAQFQEKIVQIQLTITKLQSVTILHEDSEVPFLSELHSEVNCVFYDSYHQEFIKVLNSTYVQKVELGTYDPSQYVEKLKNQAREDQFLKSFKLPKWPVDSQFYEAFYNLLLYIQLFNKGYSCYFGDKICYNFVECCDVACAVDEVLYLFHVKRSKDSDFSHLISQVILSLQIWRSSQIDTGYFEQVTEKIEELVKNKADKSTEPVVEKKSSKTRKSSSKKNKKTTTKKEARPTTEEQKKLAEDCANLTRKKYQKGDFADLFKKKQVVLVMVVPKLDQMRSSHAVLALQLFEEFMDEVGGEAKVAVMEFEVDKNKNAHKKALNDIYSFCEYKNQPIPKDEFEIIDDNLKLLQKRTKDVRADGNCMYDALVRDLHMQQYKLSIQGLRDEVSEFIRSYRYWAEITEEYNIEKSSGEYADMVKCDKEYGDCVVLAMISKCYSVDIHVHQPTTIVRIEVPNRKSSGIVHIAYNGKFDGNDGHYRAVVPLRTLYTKNVSESN